MKTPQEQAEAMARKVGLARYGTNPTYSFDAVMQIIPLPELIAVAQAVQPIVEWYDHGDITCYRNSPKGNAATEISCGEVVAIYDALQALRATGKVEL